MTAQNMALRITGVSRGFDSGFTLSDVTFDLPAGYIMGLIGPNGAGKSTLIKLILNMIRRDLGEISVLGLDNVFDEETLKTQLGVVLDSSYLLDLWTIKRAEKAVAPFYPQWNHEQFLTYLKRFGLDGKLRIADLSRGMQMKLMLAMALSHDAKLLILDEPTSGLDVLARDALMDMLRDYVADGEHAVLFSTHITSDLEHAADFITYITEGKLYYSGPKDEFEDSFSLLKGGPDELSDGLKAAAIGVRTFSTGFEALLYAHDASAFALASECPHIDDIIRLTNVSAANTLADVK